MFDALMDWIDPISDRPPVRVESSAPFTPYFVIEGKLPDHNITLTVSAFTESFLRKKLAVSVVWYKSFREKEHKIPNHDHPFYHCSPADVDLILRAEITCAEWGFEGKASIYFGPIQLSPIVTCEIQSSVFLQAHTQTVLLLQVNDEKVKINNKTRLSVERGSLEVNFDPCLTKHPQLSKITDWSGFKCSIGEKCNPQEEELLVYFDNVDPKNLFITKRTGPAGSADEKNQIAQSWQDHSMPKITNYKVQFFSRYDRDMFYVVFRLYRMLKASAIETCIESYTTLLTCDWLFLYWKVWKESGVYAGDPFDTEEVNTDNLLQYDLVREKLRSLIYLNRQLLFDRTEKMDLLDVMQTDLELAQASLRQLIEDASGAQKRGRKLSRLEVSRYEQKSRSMITETSVIIDERKVKSKSGKRNLEDQKLEELIECQEELQALKLGNQGLKKSLESEKKASSKTAQQPNQFKDATGGNEFVSFQNNNFNFLHRDPETFTFHQPVQAALAPPPRHGKLYKLLKAWNRRLTSDLNSQKETTNELRESWRRFCSAIDSGVLQNGLSEQGYLAFLASLLQRAYLAREQTQADMKHATGLAGRRVALTEDVLSQELGLQNLEIKVCGPTEPTTKSEPRVVEHTAESADMSDLLEQLAVETARQTSLETEAGLLASRRRVLETNLQKVKRENTQASQLNQVEAELQQQLEEVRQELSLLSEISTA